MYLGIEIGGTKLQLVTGDDQCRIVDRRRLSVTPAEGASGIRRQIEVTLPDLVRRFQPQAIGVGFGGPVDWQGGRICRSHQIEGWSEFDLAAWLGDLSGLPVRIDNDANAGAFGEALLGAGVGADPIFYVTLGSGVGGGLVVNGAIYHGASPGEAEIGHVRLDCKGTIVEERCSGWAVDRRIHELCLANPASLLNQMVGGQKGGEARFLASAIAGNDQAAAALLRDIASDLAFALSHVVHLFHPEMIILGGGLSKVGEPLRAAVEDALSGFCMDAFAPGPRIRLAGLGEDAVPAGALKLATAAQARKTP